MNLLLKNPDNSEASEKNYCIEYEDENDVEGCVDAGSQKIKCPLCGDKLKTIEEKERHLIVVHAVKEVRKGDQVILQSLRPYSCVVCNKEFHCKTILERHLKKAHKKKLCPTCNVMVDIKDMRLHKIQQHGDLVPTCGVCGYKALNQYLLITHQRKVHLKEKTVACEQCDMMFFGQTELKKHLIKHKPDKVYECEYCNKKFPRKSTMMMHIKIHTGEKNKTCSYCDAKFVQKASLNYHMVKYHPESC